MKTIGIFYWTLTGLLCLCLGKCYGQGSIQVHVVDHSTHQPAHFVNVYLAHTMMGGPTDDQGKVTIPNVPFGTYQLVCSFVGYTSVTHTVRVTSAEPVRLSIGLAPKSTSLTQVEISAKRDKNRKRNLRLFTDTFIGNTHNSTLCIITNPQVLNFIEDNELKELNATSEDLLVIENWALGYRYLYDIRMFKLKKKGEYAYIGLPKFELLAPKTKIQQRSWIENRMDAYRGSIRHFLNALVANNLRQQKFNVRFSLVPQLQADNLTAPDVSQIWSYGASDNELYLNFVHYMRITYDGRLMPTTFGTTSIPQTSWVKLNRGTATFNKNGQLVDPLSLIVYGYWGSEGISNLLPFEYEP
jgi:hypothetical protein